VRFKPFYQVTGELYSTYVKTLASTGTPGVSIGVKMRTIDDAPQPAESEVFDSCRPALSMTKPATGVRATFNRIVGVSFGSQEATPSHFGPMPALTPIGGGDNVDFKLKGKKAIVTGGSAGIGLAVARLLSDEGVEVTIPGRSRDKLDQAIGSLNRAVRGVETDVGTLEGAARLIELVPETDILVNNLGIYESKNFVEITDGDWLRFFEINLLGGIRLARHYFPGMLHRNWGRVIFVSSEAGAETHPDMIHYGVTKTSQVVVARGLAEMTKGTRVTVNSILPGPTRSEANDVFVQTMASTPNATFEQAEKEFFERYRPTSLLRRMADENEVASLVAYLASPLAVATNGAAVRCEGGILRTLF
jgi:NAD(P)-dependent dehydrogenase (short-subunit alcohol dehydrogenase family)